MEKNSGIQNLNSNLIVQSQISVTQQEPRIQRQIYSCQGLGNIELPKKLKKLEKPLSKNCLALFLNRENEYRYLNPEGRKLESQTSFLKQKKESKDQVSQVQFQIEALTSEFLLIGKTQQQMHRKLKKKSRYKLKNYKRCKYNFMRLIEEQEELSQLKIENMYS